MRRQAPRWRQTRAAAEEMAAYLATMPEVTDYQVYAGTSRAVQLQRPGAALLPAQRRQRGGYPGEPAADKDSRKRQSHDIAKAVRPAI